MSKSRDYADLKQDLDNAAFTGNYTDLDGLPTIPTALSELSNNVNFIATNDSPTFTNLILSGTDSIKVPVGTTSQRSSSPISGMFRYNSTTAEFEGYTTEWGAIAGGTSGTGSFTTDTFTATNGQTDFTLSASASSTANLIVFIEGVFQAQGNYSVSGTTLTLTTGLVTGRTLSVYHVEPVTIGTLEDNIVTTSSIVDDAITSAKLDTNIAIAGTLGVTGEITANGGIALGDNDKATFGASDDLQIYQ